MQMLVETQKGTLGYTLCHPDAWRTLFLWMRLDQQWCLESRYTQQSWLFTDVRDALTFARTQLS